MVRKANLPRSSSRSSFEVCPWRSRPPRSSISRKRCVNDAREFSPVNFRERPSFAAGNLQSVGSGEALERSDRGSEMASEDVVRKTTGESTVTTIVNLAKEAKLASKGVNAPGHAFLSVCKSLVAEGATGGV